MAEPLRSTWVSPCRNCSKMGEDGCPVTKKCRALDEFKGTLPTHTASGATAHPTLGIRNAFA